MGCDDGISSGSLASITIPSLSDYRRLQLLHSLPGRLPGRKLSLDQGELDESCAVTISKNLDSAGPRTLDRCDAYPQPREESRPLDIATSTIPQVEINAEACCSGLGSREVGSGSQHHPNDCGYGAGEIQHRGKSG